MTTEAEVAAAAIVAVVMVVLGSSFEKFINISFSLIIVEAVMRRGE
jgi:hypothetical protein